MTGFSGAAWIGVCLGIVAAAIAFFTGRTERAAVALMFLGAVLTAVATPPAAKPLGETSTRMAQRESALERLRERAGKSIDKTFGKDAPLARALLIADQRQIPTEMRDRYAAAGLVHMLSVSGLHVAVIATAMELLFQVGRASRRASLIGSFCATGLYVAVIGAPPPALRSAAMLGVTMASRMIQRPTSAWAGWAVGAFVPLVSPRTVLDVGYQLSVLGMCALVAAGSLWKKHLARRIRGRSAHLARELITSLVACAVTAPLVAWVFGRLSLIAPVSNLIAAPIIGLAQPMLFLALLVVPFGAAAQFVAQAVHPLLFVFDWIASQCAGVPGSSLLVATSAGAAVVGGIAAIALVVACCSRHPARPAAVGLASLALMSVAPPLPAIRNRGTMELHMLDVGQGDAVLLRTDRGRWLLFDAGPSWGGSDAGRRVVLPYILRRGGSLESFVLSHPHTDHVGGAASVIRALHPHSYWDAAFAGASEAYRLSLAVADSEGVEWHRVHPGDTLAVDGVRVRFLAPDSAWTAGLNDPNLASTIATVQFGMVRFLLVGDAEWPEENWLVANHGDELHADVLKVGHHGSSTSTSDAFLRAVHPELALISVGARNMYGHPSNDVLHALARAGAEVLRTDKAGTIVVRTDGSSIEVEAGGEKWDLASGSPRR